MPPPASAAETDEIMVKDASPFAAAAVSSYGRAASKERTAPMISMSNRAFHDSSLESFDWALALDTRASMPPSRSPAAATKALIAGPSAMSTTA